MTAPDGFLPPADEGSEEKIRFSVRLKGHPASVFPLMARAWNEIDKLVGRKRRRQWSAASAIEHLLEAYALRFEAEVGGPKRKDETDDEFVERCVATLRKQSNKR